MIANRPKDILIGVICCPFPKTLRERELQSIYTSLMDELLLPPIRILRLEELVNYHRGKRLIPMKDEAKQQEIQRKLSEGSRRDRQAPENLPFLYMERSASEIYMRLSIVLADSGLPHLIKPGPEKGPYMFALEWLLWAVSELDLFFYTATFWIRPVESQLAPLCFMLNKIIMNWSEMLKNRFFFNTNDISKFKSVNELLKTWKRINRLLYIDVLFDCDNNTRLLLLEKHTKEYHSKSSLIISLHYPTYEFEAKRICDIVLSHSEYTKQLEFVLFWAIWLTPWDIFLPPIFWGYAEASLSDEDKQAIRNRRNELLAKLIWSQHTTKEFLKVLLKDPKHLQEISRQLKAHEKADAYFDILDEITSPTRPRRRMWNSITVVEIGE